MTQAISLSMTGDQKAIANFEEMKRGLRGRILRKAVRAGSRPGIQAARASGGFNNDTGTLAKSPIVKIKTFSNTGVTSATIGPRKQAVEAYSRSKKRVVKRNPNNYAHLIELGHRVAVERMGGASKKDFVLIRRGEFAVRKGKRRGVEHKFAGQVTFVAPRHYLLQSFNSSVGAQFDALKTKFTTEVLAEAAKLGSNG